MQHLYARCNARYPEEYHRVKEIHDYKEVAFMDTYSYLILLFSLALIPAFIAKSKGREFILWYFYGVLIFIVAFPHSLLISKSEELKGREASAGRVPCPFCKEYIKPPPSAPDASPPVTVSESSANEHAVTNKTKIIIALVGVGAVVFSSLLYSHRHPNKVTAPSSAQPTQSTQSAKTVTVEQKKEASQEILQILGSVPMKVDEVEKRNVYCPWGIGAVPLENNTYWYVINKDSDVRLRTLIFNFSTDTEWVFWDKVIFSTSQGRWEYSIGSFVGQSGGGKKTDVFIGGKYERLDLPYEKLAPGYKLLLEGSNPIIRLQGPDAHFDMHLSAAQMEQITTGYRLYELLEITDGKIVK